MSRNCMKSMVLAKYWNMNYCVISWLCHFTGRSFVTKQHAYFLTKHTTTTWWRTLRSTPPSTTTWSKKKQPTLVLWTIVLPVTTRWTTQRMDTVDNVGVAVMGDRWSLESEHDVLELSLCLPLSLSLSVSVCLSVSLSLFSQITVPVAWALHTNN